MEGLDILSTSETSGIYIVADRDCRKFFITGHSEYDRGTLAGEYSRDVNKGLEINIPRNYFPADNPDSIPAMQWRSHASLLYSNWINFIVYQKTPFDLSQLK